MRLTECRGKNVVCPLKSQQPFVLNLKKTFPLSIKLFFTSSGLLPLLSFLRQLKGNMRKELISRSPENGLMKKVVLQGPIKTESTFMFHNVIEYD
jgi:hypothetical protein